MKPKPICKILCQKAKKYKKLYGYWVDMLWTETEVQNKRRKKEEKEIRTLESTLLKFIEKNKNKQNKQPRTNQSLNHAHTYTHDHSKCRYQIIRFSTFLFPFNIIFRLFITEILYTVLQVYRDILCILFIYFLLLWFLFFLLRISYSFNFLIFVIHHDVYGFCWGRIKNL